MKKISSGISSYEELIVDNYYYVDKTEYIEKLESLDNKRLMFLRPRKFGKSLFTSVLENYYDVNKEDMFDLLFKDTYIGKKPTKLKNSYYILRFDFSGIDTSSYERTILTFKNSVFSELNNFIKRYDFNFEIDKSFESEQMLKTLFMNIDALKLNNKVYVIIDEYDHFANELLSFDRNSFDSLVSENGKVRKFYEVLKQGTFTVVDRIFITGVAPITLDSLTSGFNISSNITRDSDFNNMCGFNQNEVIKIMDNLELSKEEKEKLLPVMKEYYDGYKFSIDSEEHIYNSNMCLYLLSHYYKKRKLPESLIDVNIASDYSKLAGMLDLVSDDERKKIIEKSILGEPIVSEIVSSFTPKLDFEIKDLVSILFYLGYLTIDGEEFNTPSLKIPNRVMKDLYSDYFLSIVKRDTNGSSIDYIELVRDFALNGKIDKIIELEEKFLTELSNRDYRKFDEKYVKLLFYVIVKNFDSTYLVKSEYEVNRHYPDIIIVPKDSTKGYYSALIEFKYLKKEEESKLKKVMEEAKKQASNYSSYEEFKSIDKLKVFAVVCVGSKTYLEEI